MLQNNWANIAISIRARNLSRPTLRLYKKDREVTSGPAYDLITTPSPEMSMQRLIWLSSMWWDNEGEFFWWFGEEKGFPKELICLSPRRMEYESYTKKWFFTNDDGLRIPMDTSEFVHVYEPNIWNPLRGVPPLAAMAMELEQDWSVNRETLKSLNASAIPQGILKTEQRLTAAQAEELQARWDQKYGRSKGDKRIAVLGQGTSFQALNENLLKYFEVSERNKISILTKYGVPLKVANATTEKTALSGKDSNEQYKALWSQTLIPLGVYWANELRVKLLNRFGLNKMHFEFDYSEIPELQEDEADLHDRLRQDIKYGLLTPNEARELIHYDPRDDGNSLHFMDSSEEPAKDEDDKGDEDDTEGKDGAGGTFRRGTLSVLPRHIEQEGRSAGAGNALSRFFGLVREG